MAVKSGDVERRLTVLGSEIENARPFLREPLDELRASGENSFMGEAGSSDRASLERAAVLREDLESLEPTFCRGT